MNEPTDYQPTDYQTVVRDGQPVYVLVPIEDWERVRPLLERERRGLGIPQAVVEAHVLHDVPLLRAWREHLGMTQQQVAEAARMQQSALARLESGANQPRKATLQRLAEAMGLTVEQVVE